MSAANREFLQMRMEEHDYRELPPDVQERLMIHSVKVENESYPDDETWVELKKQSSKAYKNLMNYEYDKRHKK